MLKLKDKNKKLVAGLINYKDLCIESILATGDKKLSFSLHKEDKFYNLIEEECYIETKTQEYVIKARDVGVDYTRFDCVLNLEELEANIFDRFESVEQTITASLNLAIVGTGWTVKDTTLKKKRTVRCTNKNALEIVQEIKKTYRVDIVFNTLKREIEVYEHLGENKGTYFIDSLNLTALQVQSDSYKFATRIIAEGKDGLSFSDINNGKNYVENYQYSRKVKTIYWKDERYTVKESLLEDAKAKLEEISKPYTSYNASILNLAELNPKYKNILDYQVGDTITLISRNNKVKDKQRIVKTVEYPQDHSRDTVELANAILKFEDIQQENQETTDTVNNITSDNGTLDSNAIEDNSIEIKKIDNFEANVLKVTKLDVINANIENLHANKADIQDLNAVKATVGQLEATKANITQLNATNAEISKLDTLKANIVDLNSATAKIGVLEAKTTSIDNLLSQKADIKDLNTLNANISNALIKKANVAELEAMEAKTNKLIANKADISDLNAANANINKIQAETASIKTLLNGNLSSENIQAGGITSDKLTIANGFITNLMISSVSASKITAGTIDAAKINVVNLNADNLTVGKINGQLLKDGSISGLAIENGAIDNSKVSSNANIEASKINISSVVTAINDGSTLLTANKVAIDSEKGTLDIAFNNLNTSLEDNKKVTESNSTAINVVQGKLSASIENSKILEGKQKTLEDNYNRTVVTVDSLKNTVGQQKTLIDSATGKITSVEVKANTLEKNLSGLTQTVTDTKKVIENNKTVLESKNAELKADIDSVSSSLSSVSSTVDKNNKTLVAKTNTLEQNLNGLTQTVESNKTVTDGKITSVESETHELKAGLGGLTSKLDTLKSTTDGINKTVSNQGSVINQLKDSINLKVDSSTFTQSTQTINNNINRAKEEAINTANSNTTNAINNMEVGAENLLDDSEKERTNYPNVRGEYLSVNITDIIKSNLGKQIVLSGEIKTLGKEGNINIYSLGKYQFNNSKTVKCTAKEFIPFELVITPTYNPTGDNGEVCNWSFYGVYGSGIYPCIRKLKVSLGNKKSSWSPSANDLKKYSDDVAKAKADLAQANAIANADGKITEEERKRIQQAQENLNTAIARADKSKADAKAYSDTLGQQLKANAEKYANDVAVAKSELAKEQSKAYADGIVTEEEKRRIAEARKNLDTAIAKATEAETKAKSYADSKKQEAIKAAENLALEKSNLAKKYAEDVATAKANLAKTEAIANADGKISAEEKKRIQQAQENLNTAISKADKAKQDAINEANRVAELKKQEAINSANSHADNKANEALNNAKAFVNAEITTVNSHLNKATSEINVLKEKIESKVSQSDIDKSIQEIKIGGRNLALNSSRFELPAKNTGTASDNYNYISIDANLLLNSEYTISANVEIVSGSIKEISIYDYPGGKCSRVPIINNRITYTFTKRSNTVNSVLLYAGLAGETRGNSVIFTNVMLEKGNMVSDWSPAPEDTDKLIIDNIKTVTDKITTVESKFTQENNSIKASVQDLNSTTQTITTNVSNINRDLTSKINSNLDAAKSFATDIATNKANTAKQEAINSANSHADSIAVSKANEALNNAKSYTNTEINVVNTKVHNVESNIDILKNKIALKVEQSDIDKTKTELINKINVVDNLANNAKDLASAMSLGKMLFSDPTFKNSSNNIKTYNNNGNGTVTTSRISKINGCPTDSQYCIEVKTVGSASPNHGGFYFGNITRANAIFVTKIIAKIPVGLRIGWYSNSTGNNGSSKWLTSVNGTGKWEEYIHLLKCGDTGSFSSTSFFALDGGGTPTSSNPIIWHIAYATVFDITENDESVNVLKTEMSTAKNKVAIIETNLDSITQRISSTESKTHSIETTLGGKASKQEVTEVNNRVATIKASLDSITQRVSSTESKTQTLETNLNGKASKQEVNNVNSRVANVEINLNGITNRVSSTESRINTLNGQVQNAATKQEFTEFKQTSNNFQAKIEEGNGGNNLIVNSGFNGLDGFSPVSYQWNGVNSSITWWKDNSEWVINGTNALVIQGTNGTHGSYGVRQEQIKLKPNTTYTLSGYAAAHRGKWRISIAQNDWAWIGSSRGCSSGGKNPKNWDRFVITFTTGPAADYLNNCKIDLMLEEAQNNAYAFFSNIMLNEGNFAMPWQPQNYELYGNNMVINKDKLRCTFEDGTYAEMGRDGFEWYNAGTGHAYHALTYVISFDIPIGNPGKAYIKLPAEFTKRRSSLKWTVALRGYYYSTSGDFFPFHIHCTGGRDYIENGLVVCEVQGYCKIQNAQNAGDIQFRPLTAMLIAIA